MNAGDTGWVLVSTALVLFMTRARPCSTAAWCARRTCWVSLAPVEARILAVLIARRGVVVPRRDLTRAGSPEGAPGDRSVDNRLAQLRERVEPLGLGSRGVRRRGLLLEC
jgi:DNA-binding response OmpR family regulator